MEFPAYFREEDRLASRLLSELALGDRHALDALYGIYARPLFAILLKMLGNRAESEDLLQDVFVRCYQEAGRYERNRATPFTWLATIARRLALDALRKRRVRTRFAKESTEQGAQSADSITHEGKQSHPQYGDFDDIRLQLQGLSAAQQQAIRLAYWEGLSHEEIAMRMDRPLGTIKSDLRRGLMHLREVFLNSNDR